MLFHLVIACTIFAGITALPTGRIVGGYNATVGQFPHQVSLLRDGEFHTCGGSILSEYYILTAAHCVVVGDGIAPYPPASYKVRVGSIQYNTAGQLYSLQAIIVNQNYGNFLNDVALLVTDRPMDFSDYVKPIPLATQEVASGEDVIVSGWGRIYGGGPIPNQLKFTTLKALSTEECKDKIRWDEVSLICLDHEPNNGVCNGDSGGPAVYNGEVVGIAGFVVGGCGTNNPDGYAKVFYHRDWILNAMDRFTKQTVFEVKSVNFW